MSKKLSKKQQAQFISYLNQEMNECEWKAKMTKNTDPDISDLWEYKALKLRLKIYEKTNTLERYKELYKEWVKGWVSPEEYANIDNYFEEKYGVIATNEAIAS